MRKIAIVILMFCVLSSPGQAPPEILITYNKFVYLLFPSPVTRFDLGVGAVFAEKEGNILKLIPQATEVPEASLFVTTEKGHYYFIINLQADGQLEKYTYQVSQDWMAAPLITENTEKTVSASHDQSNEEAINPLKIHSGLFDLTGTQYTTIERNLEQVYGMEKERIEIGKIGQSIATFVGVIAYDKEFIYLTVLIENEATINYHLDFIKFFVESKTGTRKMTNYEEELIPVGELVREKTIAKDEVQKYVFAFEKFTITKNKVLRVEMWEADGDRHSILHVKSRYVMNAEMIE